jgi:hypothetical protein
MTLSETVSVFGLTFGVAGFVLGILNYLRDRHKVVVTLQWDMGVTPGTIYDDSKKWGVIRVTNVGRRSTYVSHAVLRLPPQHEYPLLLIHDSIEGRKLCEGDATVAFMVTQEDMEPYAADWRDVIAQVSDSAGKVWSSKRPSKKPSWAGAA